jgi:hypothetical protein
MNSAPRGEVDRVRAEVKALANTLDRLLIEQCAAGISPSYAKALGVASCDAGRLADALSQVLRHW